MRSLALAALFAAASASAQVASPPVGPDNGFFRPTPGNDPSLTRPVPLQQPAVVTPAPIVVPVPVQVPTPFLAAESAHVAEEQLNRAKREADEAQARAVLAPAPITGAFTGQTSERDR